MNAVIIFDLNRTLYDPDTDALVPDALEVLDSLQQQGASLFLVSRNEPGREDIVNTFELAPYFNDIYFVAEKTKELFLRIQKHEGVDSERTYVVGDYIPSEIHTGNQCRMRTIWLKRGRFKHRVPKTQEETPWAVIENLKEVVQLIE